MKKEMENIQDSIEKLTSTVNKLTEDFNNRVDDLSKRMVVMEKSMFVDTEAESEEEPEERDLVPRSFEAIQSAAISKAEVATATPAAPVPSEGSRKKKKDAESAAYQPNSSITSKNLKWEYESL